MERLTNRIGEGVPVLPGWEGKARMDECNAELLFDVVDTLCAYEDTGLAPADITAMQAENKRLTAENQLLSAQAAEYRQAEADGVLVRVPHKVGDRVYVIANCQGIRRSLDGTMYSHDGSPGTATGYYCAYDEDWDGCPLAKDREECDEKGWAVFEDTISAITIYLDEENEEPSAYVGLSHVAEYRDGKTYDTEEAARSALQEVENGK